MIEINKTINQDLPPYNQSSPSASLPTPTISIIIPTLNEAELLPKTLSRLRHRSEQEIIVADGGSTDTTSLIAKHYGARFLISKPGRSIQMNNASREARGRYLIFLHADTQLPDNYLPEIIRILKKPTVSAGAFQLSIGGKKWGYRLIEFGANLRSHILSIPYGDQAIFLTSNTFEKIGGYLEIPIMEDFEFIRRLSKVGKIGISKMAATTSVRRWREMGLFLTTFYNWLIVFAYLLGVPPQKLSLWYKRSVITKHPVHPKNSVLP